MSKPKFIILNGFAGSGKTTIGKKYIAEHPLALLIEGDEIIVNIGDWLKHEIEARTIIYELTKCMARNHLSRGYDVVLPYLITDNAHIEAFEEIAVQEQALFYNFLFSNEREEAIARLMERGTWGEAGLDPLTEKDLPEMHSLYDKMEAALKHQQGTIEVNQRDKSIDDTYAIITEQLSNSGI